MSLCRASAGLHRDFQGEGNWELKALKRIYHHAAGAVLVVRFPNPMVLPWHKGTVCFCARGMSIAE